MCWGGGVYGKYLLVDFVVNLELLLKKKKVNILRLGGHFWQNLCVSNIYMYTYMCVCAHTYWIIT